MPNPFFTMRPCQAFGLARQRHGFQVMVLCHAQKGLTKKRVFVQNFNNIRNVCGQSPA